LYRFAQHSHKKAIGEIVVKILNLEPKEMSSSSKDILDLKNNIIIKIFEKLNIQDDIEKISNIVSCLKEICENKILLEIIINDENILQKIFNILNTNTNNSLPYFNKNNDNYIDEEYGYNEIINLLNYILNVVLIESLKLPSKLRNTFIADEDTVNIEKNLDIVDNTLLGQKILESLDNIIENFKINSEEEINDLLHQKKIIESTYQVNYKKLGIKR
jgi:hypothetical protein